LEAPCVDGLNYVKGESVKKDDIDVFIKSSFGFGGFSASFVMRRFKE